MGSLTSKRALITGGTTGLGLAIAERFLAEGARVVITGRNRELGEGAERTLGSGARFVGADAADPTPSPGPSTLPRSTLAVLTCWSTTPRRPDRPTYRDATGGL